MLHFRISARCIILVVLFLSLGCTADSEYQNKKGLSLDSNVALARTINLSEIFDSISYIHLESNKYISDNSELKILGNRVYLFDKDEVEAFLHVFDLKGRFLFELNKNPENPQGKIVSPTAFYVDTTKQQIEVMDYLAMKIKIFDFLGNYKSEIGLSDSFHEFTKDTKNEIYIFHRSHNDLGVSERFALADYNGNIKSNYYPINAYQERQHFINKKRFESRPDGGVLANIAFDPVFWSFEGDEGITAQYHADLGKGWIPDAVLSRFSESKSEPNKAMDYMRSCDNCVHNLLRFGESQSFFFFIFPYKYQMHWFIHSIESNKSIVIKKRINDIDGGLIGHHYYWPEGVYKNNQLYFLLPAEDVVNHKDNNPNTTFYKENRSIRIESSPIIAIAKLKPF